MKKKIFTLLTLLSLAVTGAWADDVLFSASPLQTLTSNLNVGASSTQEITSTYADISGGKITASNTDSKAYDFIAKISSNYSFLIAGSKAGFKVELDNAISAGDIISVEAYTNGAGASNDRGIFVSTATSRPSSATCTLTGHSETAKEFVKVSYEVKSTDDICGKSTVYIWRQTGNNTYFKNFVISRPVAAVATSEALKSSAAVKVGDDALSLNNATNGYSVSGTTITLSDDMEVISAPSNVKIVKTVSYDDETEKDEDVDVVFNGTVTDGYFVGTATIGLSGSETEYTVLVKKISAPTVALSATSGSVALTNSYTVVDTKIVTLEGANLTNGTYEVTADVEGTTISPTSFTVADGSVNQEFTITTSASSAATTVFTFGTSAMGATAPTYTLSYSKVAKNSLAQTVISEATTWDWKKAGDNTIELNSTTSPANNEEFLMANLPEVNNDANFNSQALKIATQFVTRGTNYYFQGYSIKFTTALPGTVDVTFSNTGGSRPYRYLRVNGTQTVFKSGSTTMVEATGVEVPAGEVTIDFYIPDASDPQTRDGDAVGTTMCRVSKIVFTPITEVAITPAYEKTTYVTTKALDFTGVDGLKAYVATEANASGVTIEEVTAAVPAGTPLLLIGTAGTEYSVPVAASASAPAKNLLEAGDGTTTFDGSTNDYILFSDGLFYQIGSGTVATNKAYLHLTGVPAARALNIIVSDATAVKAVKTVQADGACYNLSGQRVAQPSKGLYIVNGKKYIVK